MKQFEQKMEITYRWWRDDKKTIKEPHLEHLQEKAINWIGDEMKRGFLCGELHDNLRVTDRDPEDGVKYSGYWEVKEV